MSSQVDKKKKVTPLDLIHDVVRFITSSNRSKKFKYVAISDDKHRQLLAKYLNDRKFRKYWNKQLYSHINDEVNPYYEVAKLVLSADYRFPRQCDMKNISDEIVVFV